MSKEAMNLLLDNTWRMISNTYSEEMDRSTLRIALETAHDLGTLSVRGEIVPLIEDNYKRLAEETLKAEKIALLNWVMLLCGSGNTTGMIRRHCYNKIAEIEGGEKA